MAAEEGGQPHEAGLGEGGNGSGHNGQKRVRVGTSPFKNPTLFDSEPSQGIMHRLAWRLLPTAGNMAPQHRCPRCKNTRNNQLGNIKITGEETKPVVTCGSCQKKYRPRGSL